MDKKKYLTHPVSLVAMLSALLLLIMSFMSWATLPENGVVAATAEEFLAKKTNIAMGVGVVAVIVSVLAAKMGSKGLSVLNVLVALVGVVVISTAGSVTDIVEDSLTGAYYVAFLAAFALLLASVAGVFVYKKGGSDKKMEKKAA